MSAEYSVLAEHLRFPVVAHKVHNGSGISLGYVGLTHGDEFFIHDPMRQTLETWAKHFKKLNVIEIVNGGGVALGTRQNPEGFDLNRGFRSNTNLVECLVTMDYLQDCVLDNGPFDVLFTGHGDITTGVPYIYDLAKTPIHANNIDAYRNAVWHLIGGLYQGLDDATDPVLNNFVDYGVVSIEYQESEKAETGTLEEWAISHDIAKRVITVELPIDATKKANQKILEIIMEYLVLQPTL